MKNESEQKTTSTITGVLHKTADLSKKVASTLKTTATTVAEKAGEGNRSRRLKKYNPIFPDRFNNPDFHLPNMIMIVDDATYRDIDVCEGAIGSLVKINNVEILYLFDEAVEDSGLRFIPSATCDAIYYVDNFDRSRFIRTDCIFSEALKGKIAELKYIARSLGAKYCSIEINESSSETQVARQGYSVDTRVDANSLKSSTDLQQSEKKGYQNQGKFEATFQGSDKPKRPKLKWFAHDESIQELINGRCNHSNITTSDMLELHGSASATISRQTAVAIDAVYGKTKNLSTQDSMDKQASKEQKTTLKFYIKY